MDMTIAALRQYDKLSPFEIKDKLISLAKEHAQKAAAAMLNAGRGNPNWVATTPREAFFTLGQFAITESKRVMDLPDLGGMPAKEGIAARLEAWLAKNAPTPGIDFLKEMTPFAVKNSASTPTLSCLSWWTPSSPTTTPCLTACCSTMKRWCTNT